MTDSLDNPFWDFSLKVYGHAGFGPACIGLQDRRGLNVNLLIFCLWAGRQGQALSGDQFQRLEDIVAPWQAEVTRPLRAARRWLKGQALVPEAQAKALGKGILARELEGEALEQWLIARTVQVAPGEASLVTAAGNLLSYLGQSAVTPDLEDRAALITIMGGAFPEESAETLEKAVGG